MRRTIVTVALSVLLTLVAVAVISCSAKEQGRWNADTNVKIGELPSDICVVNGVPRVINANTESDGGFSLVYINKNGDVVIRAWLTDQFIGVVLKPAGQYYWTGGKCQ